MFSRDFSKRYRGKHIGTLHNYISEDHQRSKRQRSSINDRESADGCQTQRE